MTAKLEIRGGGVGNISLLFAGLLACTSSTPAPTNEATPAEVSAASSASAECAAKVTAMRTLFAQGSTEPVLVNALTDMQLPESSHGTRIEDGMPVYVHADGGFEVNAKRLATVAAVQAELEDEYDKARQLAELTGRPWQPRLVFVADQRAPAAVILELAALQVPEMTFALTTNVAGDTVPPAPPIPAAVLAAGDASPEMRSVKLAEVITPAIGTCQAIAEVFNAVATTTADMRAKVLFDGLPGAVEKCRCDGVDVETLVAAVWVMGGKVAPDTRQVLLPLARDREAAVLPDSATVGDLLRHAEAPDAKPIRLPAAS